MKQIFFCVLISLLQPTPCVAAEPVHVPMIEGAWSFTEGSNPAFQNFDFKDALFLGEVRGTEHNDIAYLDDVVLQDGIIEMDVFDTKGNVGFVFRMQSAGEFEHVYIRQRSSGEIKFIQYAPVYNDELSWQLYTHQQARGIMNGGSWTHLKAVFVGPKLELYVDGRETPSLVVENLRRGIVAGKVGILGLLPSYVANFSYTALPSSDSYPAAKITKEHSTGLTNWPNVLPGNEGNDRSSTRLIRSWQMSPAFLEDDVDVDRYPGSTELKRMKWTKVETDYDGLLPVDKFRKKQIAGIWQDNSHDMVWLKTTIQANSSMMKRFEFDFSNKTVIFINGQLLYAGNNTFKSKQGYIWGSIAWGQRGVYLPLKDGDNELLIALISESDGWGFLGRFEDGDGISLR